MSYVNGSSVRLLSDRLLKEKTSPTTISDKTNLCVIVSCVENCQCTSKKNDYGAKGEEEEEE